MRLNPQGDTRREALRALVLCTLAGLIWGFIAGMSCADAHADAYLTGIRIECDADGCAIAWAPTAGAAKYAFAIRPCGGDVWRVVAMPMQPRISLATGKLVKAFAERGPFEVRVKALALDRQGIWSEVSECIGRVR